MKMNQLHFEENGEKNVLSTYSAGMVM